MEKARGDKRCRVATYARVSTDMQAEEGKSIAAQQAEMREFATARGWEIVAEFADPGFSGAELERPGLNALRAAAAQGAFDVVLVHELSRLSHRIFDTFKLFEEWGKQRIGFASVKEPTFDFSTPTGRSFLAILAALNQYYVDILKMHTAQSKRERARAGLYNASITPYGYRHSGDANTPPVIVKKEAKAVRGMFERYATGKYSFQEIANWLNDAGYRTRSGRRFSKDTVADMLRNPFYKGAVVYRQGSRDQGAGELFAGKHEAIVSADLWEMCRQVREQRREAPRTYQPRYRVYLLNGIVACDVCRRKLRAQGAASGTYYREMSWQRGYIDCPCASKGVRTEVVDRQVGAIFRHLRLPGDWQEQLAQLPEAEEERETLESQRARLIAERRRLKEMKIRGEFDEDGDFYEQEQARIERELAKLPGEGDMTAVERAAEMLEELAEVWDSAEVADRRDLLRIALREVKVDMSQGRVMTIEPYPVFAPLFRQLPQVREIALGVFAPLLVPEQVEKMVTLPPLEEVPAREVPDWPLIVALPAERVGVRITPALSAWLKKGGRGRIVEWVRAGAPRLQVDRRKWPEVKIEEVQKLSELPDESVSFLWTPFALQHAEDRMELIAEVQRVLAPGGRWAFVDVMPASMVGHWLYRYFPQVWENEKARTWDVAQMYSGLVGAGFEVRLGRRSVYQAVRLGVVEGIAVAREESELLRILPDELYARGMERIRAAVAREGAESLVGSEYCVVEVTAGWG